MLRRLIPIALAVPLLTACPPPPPVAEAPAPAPPPAPAVTDPAPTAPAPAPDPDAAGKLRAEAARLREVVTERIHFDYDRAEIRPDARDILDRKLGVLAQQREIRLVIEGHADERGSDEYNLALGMRRALAARQYLSGRGLDAARFDVMSHGEERPLDPGTTEAAWAQNRRDEFRIVAGQVIISD